MNSPPTKLPGSPTVPNPWYSRIWLNVALLCATLAILLSIAWFAAQQLRDQHATTLREQGGAHEVYTLYEAMVVLGKLRGVSLLQRGGDASQAVLAEELHTEFRLLVRGILAEDHVRGFRIADALEHALERVKKIQAAATALDPITEFQYFGEIELDLVDMMDNVANFSDLALDPEGRSHYLTDLMTDLLPLLTAHLDALRGLIAYGSQSVAHAKLADALVTQELLTYQRKTLHSQRATGMLRELGPVTHAHTKKRIDEFETALMEAVAKYAHVPKKQLSTGRQAFKDIGLANTILLDTFNEVYGDLHTLLQQRLDRLQEKTTGIYYSAALAITLIAWVIFSVIRRTRQLHKLLQRERARVELAQHNYVATPQPPLGTRGHHFHTFAVMPWLHELINSFAELGHRLSVRFELRNALPSAYIWADKQRLGQALGNVLTFCAERSPAPGVVELRINKIDTDRIHIMIKDSGTLLTEAQQIQLLTPDTTATPRAGGRAALIAAKTIINEQQGQIDVVSDGESGTSFYIELPLVAADYHP
ncbi:MAG: ATP-binding protein [Pseudomonadota bacterium]